MTLGDFSQQAEAYSRARPDYPRELVERLLADAEVCAGDAVVDLGAGTGIFTRMLSDQGLQVTAVEPSAAMRARNLAPQARWLTGTFEATNLPAASQQWAVAAQAFHWADPARALPEIRRVLQPGRFFTILWNNRANQNSEVLGWTEAAIRRLVPEFDEAYRNRPWGAILESTGDFCLVKEYLVPHVVPMTRERYLQLWKSHNRLTTVAGPERFARLLKEIEAYLDERQLSTVEVPYRCEAWSACRSD